MYNEFVNLYPVTKTLRFELKPIGKTLEKIRENKIIDQDEHRAESYKKTKELIDEYHKNFIDSTLKKCKIDIEKMNSYYDMFISKEKDREKLKAIENELRNDIITTFTEQKQYKELFGEKMITDFLPSTINDETF